METRPIPLVHYRMMRDMAFHMHQVAVVCLLFVLGADYRIGSPQREERVLAAGVTHRVYVMDGPYRADVIRIDRAYAHADLLAWRSGGLQRTTAQARDAGASVRRVIAAINADFYSFQTTWPVSYHVMDGEFVHATPSARSHMLVGPEGEVFFDRPTYRGYVVSRRDTLRLVGVNRARNGLNAVWYNHHAQDRVRSDSTGFMIRLRPISGGKAVVVGVTEGYGPAVVSDPMISVGPRHPSAGAFRGVAAGDTLIVRMGFTEAAHRSARQVLGGGGMILENGQPVQDLNETRERLGRNFMTARHPRTVVATNADRSLIWLVTIDGRQEASLGMSFAEMADFLLTLGATDALNLDGGGSTAMVIDGEVVNRPSDITGERAVANVLLLVER